MIICGPTATGKSGLGLALAERLNSPILSADSRQIYREFNIGTAKPSLEALSKVPHSLINICDPRELFTLAQYQAQAQGLITQVHDSGQIPLLVGGTGLYIRAIAQGLKIPKVAPHPELRSQLQSLGQAYLYQLLHQVDSPAAAKIHPHDQVRTLRALEVYYVTGTPLSEQQGERVPDYPILQIGLDCPDGETLTQRIEQRTEQMLAQGWLAELQQLCDQYGADLPLLETLGYQELKQHLLGETSLTQAKHLIVLHTRQFAKRQRTWFRANPQIQWFDADHPALEEQVWQQVQQFCQECLDRSPQETPG